jgi:hypothetical protein
MHRGPILYSGYAEYCSYTKMVATERKKAREIQTVHVKGFWDLIFLRSYRCII